MATTTGKSLLRSQASNEPAVLVDSYPEFELIEMRSFGDYCRNNKIKFSKAKRESKNFEDREKAKQFKLKRERLRDLKLEQQGLFSRTKDTFASPFRAIREAHSIWRVYESCKTSANLWFMSKTVYEDKAIKTRIINFLSTLALEWAIKPLTLIDTFRLVLTFMNVVDPEGLATCVKTAGSRILAFITECWKGRPDASPQLPSGADARYDARTQTLHQQADMPVINESNMNKMVPMAAGASVLLGSILAGKYVTSHKGAEMEVKKWAEYGKNISFIDRGIKTVSDLVHFVMDSVSRIYNNHTGQEQLSKIAAECMAHNIDIKTLMSEMDRYANPNPLEVQILNSEDGSKILAIREEINRYTNARLDGKLTSKHPGFTVLERKINEYRTWEKDHAQEILQAGQAERTLPYVVEFFGAPSAGKSVAARRLAESFKDSRLSGKEYDRDHALYAYNPGLNHMDGYTGQPILLMDDTSQSHGAAPSQSEYMFRIRMFSDIEFIVPKADLSTKGQRFTSDIVICTTNTPFPEPQEVLSKTALWRRRNALVKTIDRDTYQLCEPLGGVSVNSASGTPHIIPKKVDGVALPTMTFVELVKYLVVDLREHRKKLPNYKDLAVKFEDLGLEQQCTWDPLGDSQNGSYSTDCFCCLPHACYDPIGCDDGVRGCYAELLFHYKGNDYYLNEMPMFYQSLSDEQQELVDILYKRRMLPMQRFKDDGVPIERVYLDFAASANTPRLCEDIFKNAAPPMQVEEADYVYDYILYQPCFEHIDGKREIRYRPTGPMNRKDRRDKFPEFIKFWPFNIPALPWQYHKHMPYMLDGTEPNIQWFSLTGEKKESKMDTDDPAHQLVYRQFYEEESLAEYREQCKTFDIQVELFNGPDINLWEEWGSGTEDEGIEPQIGERLSLVERHLIKREFDNEPSWFPGCKTLAEYEAWYLLPENLERRQDLEDRVEAIARLHRLGGRNPFSESKSRVCKYFKVIDDFHCATNNVRFVRDEQVEVDERDIIHGEYVVVAHKMDYTKAAGLMPSSNLRPLYEEGIVKTAPQRPQLLPMEFNLPTVATDAFGLPEVEKVGWFQSFKEDWKQYNKAFYIGAVLSMCVGMLYLWLKTNEASNIIQGTFGQQGWSFEDGRATLPAAEIRAIVEKMPLWSRPGMTIELQQMVMDVMQETWCREKETPLETQQRVGTEQQFSSGDNTTSRHRIARIARLAPQSGENIDGVESMVKHNMVVFECNVAGTRRTISGLAIGGHKVMVAHHSYKLCEGKELAMLDMRKSEPRVIKFTPSGIKPLKRMGTRGKMQDVDVGIIELPASCERFRDITDKFISEEDVQKLQVVNVVEFERDPLSYYSFNNYQSVARLQTGEFKQFNIARYYELPIHGRNGRCGAPLLHCSTAVNARILGLHVAGTNASQTLIPRTVVQLVTREMINGLEQQGCIEAVGLNEYVGDVSGPMVQKVPRGSKIRKSPIYAQIYEPTTGPSVLSKSDPRISFEARAGPSPLQMQINKFSEPAIKWSDRAFACAVATINMILSNVVLKNGEKRDLTEEEMINGVPVLKYPMMNMSTSAGLPYKTEVRNHGKYGYFEQRPGLDTYWYKGDPGEKLRQDVLEMDSLLREGKEIKYLAFENLKDERRSFAKIAAAQTRTFDCLPVSIQMLTRKYFGAWVAAMQQRCDTGPISVGISHTTYQWKSLYDRLNRFGGDVIAGDYKTWDGKLMPDVMEACCEAICNWYGPGDTPSNRARRELVRTFIHTDLVVLDTIVRKHQGIPSGVAITAPFNSLCNMFYIVAATYEICKDQGHILTPREFVEETELATYGDDHIIAFSSLLREFVNFSNFRTKMNEHNIGYTDSQKRLDVQFEFEKLEDVTFLKRKFKEVDGYPGVMFAPLEENSIKEETNWVKENGDRLSPWEALVLNLGTCVDEWFLHGKSRFENERDKINRTLDDNRPTAHENGVALYNFTETYQDRLDRYVDEYFN